MMTSKLTSAQKTLVSIIVAIANADGVVTTAELEVMLDEFALLFALDEQERPTLRRQLQELSAQDLSLETLIPQLITPAEREIALKLGYIVIQADPQSDQLTTINPKEKTAYRTLVDLLSLPETTVAQIEWTTDAELKQSQNWISVLTTGLSQFFHR